MAGTFTRCPLQLRQNLATPMCCYVNSEAHGFTRQVTDKPKDYCLHMFLCSQQKNTSISYSQYFIHDFKFINILKYWKFS